MKKIIYISGVFLLCAMIFFDITSSVRAQSLRPRFLTAQLFNPSTSICWDLRKCRIFGGLNIRLTDVDNTSKKPGYSKAGPEFAYGSEDYPNPREYTPAPIKVIIDSIPRGLKNSEILITQKLPFPEPGDPTNSLIKFLYSSENGDFIKLKSQRVFNVSAIVPKPGDRITINVEVRGKSSLIDCLSFWCPPPSQWKTFSKTASIIPDTGEPYLELYTDGISLTCPKRRFEFPSQEAQYLVTVPIFAGDEYDSPNRAASGINPQVELSGTSFADTYININKKGDSLSFVVSERDLNSTFVAGIKDNVGHESERWAFQIPPEKMERAMWECNRYLYPMPASNPSLPAAPYSSLPAFNPSLPASKPVSNSFLPADNPSLPPPDFFLPASNSFFIPGADDNKY